MSQTLEPGAQSVSGESASRRIVQEPIQSLPYFASLILRAAKNSADSANLSARFAAACHAECLACGITLPGDQLLLLGQEQPASDEKLSRLQKGYCARRTCDSRFYRLVCTSAPGVDWTPIFNIKDGYASAPETTTDESSDDAPQTNRTRQVVAASGALLLLVLTAVAWRLYVGGSIPFICPAEKFTVDAAGVAEELSRIQ
jgi:hypothetical protein